MDDDMANIIVAQLLYLDAVDPTKVPFTFRIVPTCLILAFVLFFLVFFFF